MQTTLYLTTDLRAKWSLITSMFMGFTPIASLSAYAFGLIDLPIAAVFIVLPSYLLLIYNVASRGFISKLIVMGWLAGVIAVSVYDISRIPFILMGWDDFIPKIGHWLMGSSDTPGVVGYLWRYIGNGGGLGIAFACIVHLTGITGKTIVRWGTTFGLIVFLCLCATLKLSHSGEAMMFELTPIAFGGSIIGHIVYGLVLGVALKVFLLKQSMIDEDGE